MKKLTYISSIFIIFFAFIISVSAEEIKKIPMGFYWNIYGKVISDDSEIHFHKKENAQLLSTGSISNSRFWTNDAFQEGLEIWSFTGSLEIKIVDGTKTYSSWTISRENNTCPNAENIIFSEAKVCKYNIDLMNARVHDSEDDPEYMSWSTLSGSTIEKSLTDLEQNNKKIIIIDTAEKAKKALKSLSWSKISAIQSETWNIALVKKNLNFSGTQKSETTLIFIPLETDNESLNSLIVLPKNTEIAQTGAIIYPPKKITPENSHKTKIQNLNSWKNVSVLAWINIETNQNLTFSSDIDICMNKGSITHLNNKKIYYSQDGNSWHHDTQAKELILDGDKICFKTNHLTQFLISEITTPAPVSSGWGGGGWGWGGWGWSSYPTCKDEQLVCKLVKGSKTTYKWYKKSWEKCTSKQLWKICSTKDIVTQTGSTQTGSLNDKDKITKVKFKDYKKGNFSSKKFQNLWKKLDKILFVQKPNFETESLVEKYNSYLGNLERLNINFEKLEIAIAEKNKVAMKNILKDIKPLLKSLIKEKKEFNKFIVSEKNKLKKQKIPEYYVLQDKRLKKVSIKFDKLIKKYKKTEDVKTIEYRNETLKMLDEYILAVKSKDKAKIRLVKKDFIRNYKLFVSQLKKK